MRFAQERLGKEQQAALTAALKAAEKARLAQLLRVVRTAHCPSLAAFLASWRAAAVAEQVARHYYHAAAVAGNYYYAQGAVAGAIAPPQEVWRLYTGAHEEYAAAAAEAVAAVGTVAAVGLAAAPPSSRITSRRRHGHLGASDEDEDEEEEEGEEVVAGEEVAVAGEEVAVAPAGVGLATPHTCHREPYAVPSAFPTQPTARPLPTPGAPSPLLHRPPLPSAPFGLGPMPPPPPGAPLRAPLLAHMPLPVAPPPQRAGGVGLGAGGARGSSACGGGGGGMALGESGASGESARAALIAKSKASRANRRYAALACAVRTGTALGSARLNTALGRWRLASFAMSSQAAARDELKTIHGHLHAAAEGRKRTQAALRLAAVYRCLRSGMARRLRGGLVGWASSLIALDLCRSTSAHAAASVAAAAAAAEVARLSDTLSRERLVSAARPLHLQNSINEGKHAAHAAELARAEAEAKLREAHKNYAASEVQVRSLTDRLAKAQKEASRETKALSTALGLGARHRALRIAVLSDGRWCVPRALERWRAAARYQSSSAAVSSSRGSVLSPGYDDC